MPVLRVVPKSAAVATAAMNALLAGPTAKEAGDRTMTTAIPDGTGLLGVTIKNGVATVNLSTEFDSGGGTASLQYRLAQVVYTLTQFTTIKSVVFQIEGQTVTVFGSEGIVLDGPVGRADYTAQLPAIFVDRPAYGAAIGNPAKVSGNADVFEATFRAAILDGSGKTLVDQQVMASCGTGCRGTFSVTLPYTVGKAQYGTLRVVRPVREGRHSRSRSGTTRSGSRRPADDRRGHRDRSIGALALPAGDAAGEAAGEAVTPVGLATNHFPPTPWPVVSPAFESAA